MVACAPGLPAPSVTSVEPDWLYNGDYEPIVVVGEHFYPRVELDVRDADGRLDRQFVVELEADGERVALDGVELLDYEHISGHVPTGLEPGRYTVIVTSPMDDVARLPRGFTVTDTRADHLQLSTASNTAVVEESFDVGLALHDPGGEVLLQAFDVQLDITAPEGLAADDLTIDTSNFDDASIDEISDGYRIGLTLRAGSADRNVITLTGHAPAPLELELSPADPDSEIEPHTTPVSVLAGSLNTVEIQLPHSGFSTTAGESFEADLRLVDEFGNLIDYATAVLVLYEECGSASEAVEVLAETTVVFTPTGATTEDCPENHILASGTVSGSSEGFEVLPADAVEYDVSVFPNSVVAGDEEVFVTIRALDAFGNQVVDYGDEWFEQQGKELQVELVDELGGLDPGTGYGTQDCPGFEDGYQICQAWPTVAGETDQLTATGDDGLSGKSGTFEVVASDLYDFVIDYDTPPFQAGVPFALRVRPVDRFGNTVDAVPGSYVYEFEGSPYELSCDDPTATAEPGEWSFDCVATTAVAEQLVTVSVGDVSRTLDEGFEIENGSLGVAVIGLSGTSFEAGQPFSLQLDVYDAYGNPYLVQAVTSVDLEDCTGSLSPTSISFDAVGHGETTGTITQSVDSCVVTALDGGVELGDSAPFEVTHSTLAGLDVSVPATWIFLGEELDVRLRAVDSYGNSVVDFDEAVELSSSLGSFATLTLDSFDEGELTTQPDFDTAALADTLEALSDSGLSATSSALDVLDGDCGTVTASLLVDGSSEPVMCLTTGTVTSVLDASGSSGSVAGYHFDDGAGNQQRLASPSTTTAWTSQAAYLVTGVVFDSAGCGDIDQVVAYVAEPDGEPAGPVTVTPVDAVRVVGSSTDGSTQVDIEAFDCAGDVAAYGTLLVRTTIGEITAGATASGQGLALTLDSAGQGQLTWSVASSLRGGISEIITGREGSIAYGAAGITAVGDDAVPVVLELDPGGASQEITDTLLVRFDEAMRDASLSGTNVTLSDSAGALDIDSIGLDTDGTTATITLVDSVDLAADVYTLELADQVRDEAGNRLDGDWDGVSSSFVIELGDVADSAPDVIACSPDTTTLRPDGDDQPATDEADLVEVDLTADSGPAWWLIEVFDAAGLERYREWVAAGSAGPELVSWDARDQSGGILPNGSYTMAFSAADSYLDLGMSCEVDIVIDNVVVEVP